MRVNYGEWDTYNHSTIAVLDGETGHKLWSFGSIKTGMMSGLSLASTSLGADAAVFITMGTIEDNNSTAQVSYNTCRYWVVWSHSNGCGFADRLLTGGERY